MVGMTPEERAAALAAISPEQRAAALVGMTLEERAAALAAISPGHWQAPVLSVPSTSCGADIAYTCICCNIRSD